MRLAGLLSGGKDSVYAAHKAQTNGHTLTHIVTLHSENPESYMFHTVNTHITKLQAQAWGIPYVSAITKGIKEKELEDLRAILEPLDIDGVITGAIASEYQAKRVTRLCEELDLQHYHPLWGLDRKKLLMNMLDAGMNIIITAVAAQGLDQTWLGQQLTPQTVNKLKRLSQKYHIDLCGEGGEYETIVIDAPWFTHSINIIRGEKTWDGVSGRYNILEAQLQRKTLHKNYKQRP